MIPANIVYIILGLIFSVFLADLINAVRTALDIRKLMDKMRSMKDTLEQKWLNSSNQSANIPSNPPGQVIFCPLDGNEGTA